MMRGLRRVLILLLFALSLQLSAHAASAATVEELNIRINQAGAQVTVTITGTPNSWVSVELLYPDAAIGQAYSADKKANVLAGLDMLPLSDSGEAVYTYTADEQTGIYTLRASGAIDSVAYTAENNELTDVESDVFFAEMWTSAYENVYTDNVQGAIWLRKNMLNNMESTARRIKSMMDLRAPGRRMLYIDVDISNMFIDNSENYIWEWSEVEAQAQLLEEFFDIYYHAGGQLDGIYTDCEQVMSTWELQRLVNEAGSAAGEDAELREELKATKLQEVLDGILADPLYTEKIEPELIKRGFYFHDGDEYHKLYQAYSSYNGGKAEYGNEYSGYLVWSTVMDNYKSECLRAAVYEPAAKFFPHINYSNYNMCDRLTPLYTSATHKYYLGGNKIKAGTHSSPVLYDSSTTATFYSPDGSSYTVEDTPFAEAVGLINNMRGTVLSTPGGKTMPWVTARYANNEFNRIKDDLAYYYEYFIHVAMCNPDALLFYGPYYTAETTDEQVQANIQGLYEVMEELDTYADRKNARSLVGDRAPANQHYVLSGMYTKGRHLWRITYDNTALAEGQSFRTDSGATPTFCIDGITATFPEGAVLENIYSEYGYWIETPAGVYPAISYDTPPTDCDMELRLYDEDGMPLSDAADTAEIDTVALFYNGLPEYAAPENGVMYFAEYDDRALVRVGPLHNPIWGGTRGQLVFNEFEHDGKSKILFWEGLDSLKPVLPALPWDGK